MQRAAKTPSWDRRVLVAAARMSPDGAPAPRADWPRHEELLAGQQLLGAAYLRLDLQGASRRTRERMQRSYARALRRGREQRRVGLEALASLGEGGLRAAPLKGLAAMLRGHCADPGLRPMADVDLYVGPAAFARAQELLCQRGCELLGPPELDPAAHARSLRWLDAREPVLIDLHRYFGFPHYAAIDHAATLGRSRRARQEQISYQLLDPADEVLMLAQHLARSFYALPLRALADLDALLRFAPPSAPRLLALARESGLVATTYAALLASAELFASPTPPGLLAELSPRPWRRLALQWLLDLEAGRLARRELGYASARLAWFPYRLDQPRRALACLKGGLAYRWRAGLAR